MKKPLLKTLCGLTMACSLGLGMANANAQVFDTPALEFALPQLINPQFQIGGFPNTLQIGDLEPTFLNPVTGGVLNDVVFVTNPIPFDDSSLTVRFFTVYHTSSDDTRAMSVTSPGDLVYSSGPGILGFGLSSSVQILDLDRDGQNDLAFSGSDFGNDPDSGSSPVIGAMGSSSQPFVTGSLVQLGTSIDQSTPISLPVGFYSGQPVLGVGDLDGDGNLDLAFNDLEFPAPAGAGEVGGAGLPSLQRLHALLNNGALGPLTDMVTDIAIPDPVLNDIAYGQFLSLADFNGDGIQDAGVVYMVETVDVPDGEVRAMVYLGNGDGTFNAQPDVNEVVATNVGDIYDDPDVRPIAMTVGNLDGNGYLDMAIMYLDNANGTSFVTTEAFTALVNCAPGTPPSCTVQQISFGNELITTSIAAGDFDLDGVDDIAQLEVQCTQFMPINNVITNVVDVSTQGVNGAGNQVCVAFNGYAAVYLNQGGSISTTPDQTIVPTIPAGTSFFPFQVVANDIDGCSPEDLAFTGIPLAPQQAGGTGVGSQGGLPLGNEDGIGVIAFTSVLDPLADAGVPVEVNGGFQIGGSPTCSDGAVPTWTQLSGTPANISDTSAANPIVSGVVGEAVFQVTCNDGCGQATDTVTVVGNNPNYIEGSGCGSSLHGNLAGTLPQAYGWMLLGGLAFGGLLRRRFGK